MRKIFLIGCLLIPFIACAACSQPAETYSYAGQTLAVQPDIELVPAWDTYYLEYIYDGSRPFDLYIYNRTDQELTYGNAYDLYLQAEDGSWQYIPCPDEGALAYGFADLLAHLIPAGKIQLSHFDLNAYRGSLVSGFYRFVAGYSLSDAQPPLGEELGQSRASENYAMVTYFEIAPLPEDD